MEADFSVHQLRENEGRPFEASFQAGFKPLQAASVKSRGGERWGKSLE